MQSLKESAHARGLAISCVKADLESDPLPVKHYDLIVLVRYTSAALVSRLLPLLAEGGCIVCEEHLVTDADVIGPSSAAFRVAPGELRQLLGDLTILFYSEGFVEDPDGRRAALARVVARRV